MVKLKVYFYIFLIIIIVKPRLYAQKWVRLSAKANICAVDGDSIKRVYEVYEPSPEVKEVVLDICKKSGTDPNKFKLRAADVAKAYAHMDSLGNRYIDYNPMYINEIKRSSKTYWSMVFVLAHEIGHHFNNDLFNTSDVEEKRKSELAADKVAGCALAHMGANKEEVEKTLSIFKEQGDETHPSRNLRLFKALEGFHDCKNKRELNIIDTINAPCTKGNIFFRNLTGSKIRISKIVNNIWRDTKQSIEIMPNYANRFIDIPAGFTTFYIEISKGKSEFGDIWQKYDIVSHRVQKCAEEPPPIDIN